MSLAVMMHAKGLQTGMIKLNAVGQLSVQDHLNAVTIHLHKLGNHHNSQDGMMSSDGPQTTSGGMME